MSDDQSYDSVVFSCVSVQVYAVPPPSGKGFRTDAWGPLRPIFNGRLRVIETTSTQDSSLDVRIEDKGSGELFASAPYVAEYAVERALDSSRYFQLRVVHEKRVAYLGIGFEDRDASFDFQVALSDFLKRRKITATSQTKDYSLKIASAPHILGSLHTIFG